jgi:glycerol-3-phosphate dehydrogenase
MNSSAPDAEAVDLLVIGGGINGTGIARDAAGRGLSVELLEKDDLASATSGWSSKLVHGGLRYLEQYEFRLVREALQEREVMLRLAPHIIRPLAFVLPHDRSMRPVWMIRAGLFLYDHLGSRVTLPGSKGVSLAGTEYGEGFRPEFREGFVYSDCRVDDARLTLVNAMSARDKGARVRTRTRFERARRVDGVWEVEVSDAGGARTTIRARGLVNTAGPWVMDALGRIEGDSTPGRVRLVKGSHIVVPAVHPRRHAWILQNPDKRVAFVIPYEGRFSLIGTTDVAVDDIEAARDIGADEVDYLVGAVNRFLAKPISKGDVVWSYAGVRPLYDDGATDPSKITRDYVLKLDHAGGKAPLVTIFGGKITTYRCLAEETLHRLAPFYPGMRGAWTSTEALPGGDVPHFNRFCDEMLARHAGVGREIVEGIVRRHGARAPAILEGAGQPGDLGRHFGGGLTEREVEAMRRDEWAMTAGDVLWRRSKCGLHMSPEERRAFEDWF